MNDYDSCFTDVDVAILLFERSKSQGKVNWRTGVGKTQKSSTPKNVGMAGFYLAGIFLVQNCLAWNWNQRKIKWWVNDWREFLWQKPELAGKLRTNESKLKH